MDYFILNQNTRLAAENNMEVPVKHAVDRWNRDMSMTILPSKEEENEIVLKKENMEKEAYRIEVQKKQILIFSATSLGFIYALHSLSETYLEIQPFWFWNDQKLVKKEKAEIPCGVYEHPKWRIRYRGWFINDEVLISHWNAGVSKEYPWQMVFEALLRLGGNLVIPGTDKNARIYAPLACEMGLMITHHHAEPLGAEMFARAYPELEPSYLKHEDLFVQLWKEAVERQKDQQVVWNIGFRGQGDVPFWENDPAYDTDEKRGKLISDIMKKQYRMVREIIPDAVFCTNLYGEILELYRKGFLSIPEDVILIWADNGYGKMVSRRQGNHNPRISALPDVNDKGEHGTYYHVSFYDLQAANHITMLPNSMEFVERELTSAYEHRISQLWIINASNIKPHVYPLDFIANLWKENPLSAEEHRRVYLRNYYTDEGSEKNFEKMEQCMTEYAGAMIPFGEREDEHAGEQFYNYVVRDFIHGWMKDGGKEACEELLWFSNKNSFAEQIEKYKSVCAEGVDKLKNLRYKCGEACDSQLWLDSLMLHVMIHEMCLEGSLFFVRAYEAYAQNEYRKAFFLLGNAAEMYENANTEMRSREHDKWMGFYQNDCLTDLKETGYCLKRLMGYIRNIGDGPDFYIWQREVTYSKEDCQVVLITHMENHLTDWELYLARKEQFAESEKGPENRHALVCTAVSY